MLLDLSHQRQFTVNLTCLSFYEKGYFVVFNDKPTCVAHKQTWQIELENSCEVVLNFCQSRIWGDLDTINQAEISDCLCVQFKDVKTAFKNYLNFRFIPPESLDEDQFILSVSWISLII